MVITQHLNKRGKILFIDASDEFTKERSQSFLLPVHLSKILKAYQEYAIASLKLMITYLKELKNLGIYDNSSIIISADHGSGEYTDKVYNSSEGRYLPALKNGKVMASGKPLLLVKNYLENHPLKISSKPVSLPRLNQGV